MSVKYIDLKFTGNTGDIVTSDNSIFNNTVTLTSPATIQQAPSSDGLGCLYISGTSAKCSTILPYILSTTD
ncbi:MAG: hypothetical protein PHC28_15700, partial [Flavobacterium sp.]|uniref:hypothetical protein n=1 Tax=Flavobacterium sp. TaxID=239 RepID=UPI00262AFFFB